MSNKCAEALDLAARIETEIKKLGLWKPTESPGMTASGAFGADSLTFEEWLQFIFLPNLRQAALTNALPTQSSVGVAAVRNLDGLKGSEPLVDLLSRVDRLVKG